MEIFDILLVCFFFPLKHRLWVLVRTDSMSANDLCFRAKLREKKMYSPVLPSFTILKLGVRGSKSRHGRVIMI